MGDAEIKAEPNVADAVAMVPPRSLRDIYPDAREDAEITVATNDRIRINARAWERGLQLSGGISAIILIIGDFGIPDALMLSAAAIWLIAMFMPRVLKLRLPRRYDTSWAAWGRQRGLSRRPRPRLDYDDMPALMIEPGRRQWSGVHHGRIGDGSITAWMGHMTWRPREDALSLFVPIELEFVLESFGHEIDRSSPRAVSFLAVDLGTPVDRWLPASRVRAFLDGAAGLPTGLLTPDMWSSDETRFESIKVDETLQIHVEGPIDRWHRVFDPTTIAALAADIQVQWIQQRRSLVLLSTRGSLVGCDSAAMDSLAAAAALLAPRFREVARSLEAEARRTSSGQP